MTYRKWQRSSAAAAWSDPEIRGPTFTFQVSLACMWGWIRGHQEVAEQRMQLDSRPPWNVKLQGEIGKTWEKYNVFDIYQICEAITPGDFYVMHFYGVFWWGYLPIERSRENKRSTQYNKKIISQQAMKPLEVGIKLLYFRLITFSVAHLLFWSFVQQISNAASDLVIQAIQGDADIMDS